MKKIYSTLEEAQKAAERFFKKEEIRLLPRYLKMYRGYVLMEEDEEIEDVAPLPLIPPAVQTKQRKDEIHYQHRETFLKSLKQKKYETKKEASKAAESERLHEGDAYYEQYLQEEALYRLEAFEVEEQLFEPLFLKVEREKEAEQRAREKAAKLEQEKEEAFQQFVAAFERKRGIQKKPQVRPVVSESCFQKQEPCIAYESKKAAEKAAGPLQEAYYCPKCEKYHLSLPDGRRLECLGICNCTDRSGNRKELYKTRLEALKHLRQHKGKKGQELEIYLCPQGYGFHLTSRKA